MRNKIVNNLKIILTPILQSKVPNNMKSLIANLIHLD